MVKEAEKYKDEDDKQRERLQAKNALEGYAFGMKSTVEDEKLKDKISAEDKQTVLDKCNDIIRWIDSNQVKETPLNNQFAILRMISLAVSPFHLLSIKRFKIH